MTGHEGTVWCEVELDTFARSDFDKVGDRLEHVRNIPDNGDRHFADGFGDEAVHWRAPVRAGNTIGSGRGNRR